jgi:hypothetical protein
VSFDVATLESRFATVASYVDSDGAMTWVATSAKFWMVWGFRVCSLGCPQQHMCVQADILCGLGVLARMPMLTVCMSKLTLSHVD